jgi:hypothetical protein
VDDKPGVSAFALPVTILRRHVVVMSGLVPAMHGFDPACNFRRGCRDKRGRRVSDARVQSRYNLRGMGCRGGADGGYFYKLSED